MNNAAIADEKLAEIVRRLAEAYEPERIYLFGSHARGDAGPDSDYDLLVIVPTSAPAERQRSRLHFNTQATGIQCGDTSASLTGETIDGQMIQGSDAINTVGCK